MLRVSKSPHHVLLSSEVLFVQHNVQLHRLDHTKLYFGCLENLRWQEEIYRKGGIRIRLRPQITRTSLWWT